jgi:hypothetical protein
MGTIHSLAPECCSHILPIPSTMAPLSQYLELGSSELNYPPPLDEFSVSRSATEVMHLTSRSMWMIAFVSPRYSHLPRMYTYNEGQIHVSNATLCEVVRFQHCFGCHFRYLGSTHVDHLKAGTRKGFSEGCRSVENTPIVSVD